MAAKPAPAAPARKWKRRAAARPDELLNAALDEFIAKGFDAARIEDIARRAGLSKGAVYLYFAGKEELLRGLIEREVSPLLSRVGEMARQAEDPRATLKSIARMIGAAMANPRLVAVPLLIVSVANRFPDLAAFYREEVAQKAKSGVEALVRRGVALGQFRKVAPHAAARTIIGPLLFEALWTHVLRGRTGMGVRNWAEAQVEIVLRGLET
ncbi:MAG: TetR/AcrR family transcriptional regulator [Hyphomonadaceae bacterium]